MSQEWSGLLYHAYGKFTIHACSTVEPTVSLILGDKELLQGLAIKSLHIIPTSLIQPTLDDTTSIVSVIGEFKDYVCIDLVANLAYY